MFQSFNVSIFQSFNLFYRLPHHPHPPKLHQPNPPKPHHHHHQKPPHVQPNRIPHFHHVLLNIATARPINNTAYDKNTARKILAIIQAINNEIISPVPVNIHRPHFFIFLHLPLVEGMVIKRPNVATKIKTKRKIYHINLSSIRDQVVAASSTAVLYDE